MENSNISFDHVQLVIMQELLKKGIGCKQTVWNKIGSALGICKPKKKIYWNNGADIIQASFSAAEMVMIARRTKKEIDELIADKSFEEAWQHIKKGIVTD